jgi:hypothetical protein
MTYWVVMFDRDGGECDPEGPFANHHEAEDYTRFCLDDWRWVSYEIQEGDE